MVPSQYSEKNKKFSLTYPSLDEKFRVVETIEVSHYGIGDEYCEGNWKFYRGMVKSFLVRNLFKVIEPLQNKVASDGKVFFLDPDFKNTENLCGKSESQNRRCL